MNYNPFYVLFRSALLLARGRARFPRARIGETLVRDDGRPFTLFRQVVIRSRAGQPEVPQGVFQVWFSTKASAPNTIRLSYLTLFGFLGLPGFRSKLWLYNEESNEFGGIYEWETLADAHNYDQSYAMKFSHWRSLPGKFRTVVFPHSDPRAATHRAPDDRFTARAY